MKYFVILFTLFSFKIHGMCNFPHIPASYCVKANVSNLKKYTKSKTFKCEADLEILKIYRPKSTYSYSDNLDLIKYDKNTSLDLSNFSKNKKIYSKNCHELNAKFFLVNLSCYDSYAEFEDYTFLNHGKLVDKIYDPWKQVDVTIDCSFLEKLK